ncbi:O-antigen polymerase [Dolichospermum compactum]|uniref:O-antigen polymerase n=1 Tax=Dolichospermum compactum NIES-806 TaxID=1973481 RepID=A0A1Z4V5R2_9CYAN|nr:O-antigen polymerase [Dolichospermum compactum]BAZ86763.1 hypothetical protein NIES806_29790 [Dolichospermum compactum NIES-806]
MNNSTLTKLKTDSHRYNNESPFVPMHWLHRILLIAIIVIYLLFVVIQVYFNPKSTVALQWVNLGLVVNFLLLLIPVIFYQPSYGWFHPLIFNIVLTLIHEIRKTPIYINGLESHIALPNWNSESLTFLLADNVFLSIVGLVSYYCGFFFSLRFGNLQLTFLPPRHLKLKVLCVVIFSIVACAAYMQIQGGIAAHILSWGQGRRATLAGQFYWQFLIQFGAIACLIWLAKDPKAHFQGLFWICSLSSLVINFLSGGSRSSVIYFIIFGLLVSMIRDRKIAFMQILTVVVIGLFLLGILGDFRNSTWSGETNWNTLNQASPIESIFGLATDELGERSGEGSGEIPILALVPNQVDFLYGRSYLAALTILIPRGLWPGKPGLVDGVVGNTFFYLDIGIPIEPTLEAYWNFGVPGVFIVFFAFGLFHKWLVWTFRNYATEPLMIVPYVLTLYLLQPSGPGIMNWIISLTSIIILFRGFGLLSFRSKSR